MKKKLKITVNFITVLILLLLMSVVTIYGADNSGTYGGNISWEFDEYDKTLTLSGNGHMNFQSSVSGYPWYSFQQEVKHLVVEEGITNIPRTAFEDYKNIESVSLPESLLDIEHYAFTRCDKLNKIELPKNLISIGVNAFNSCINLRNMAIPEGVTEISAGAFAECSNLKTVTISNGTETISSSAFANTAITSLELPDSLRTIGNYAFSDCNGMTEIAIPNNVETIGDSAFYGCNGVSDIIIPDSVSNIGQQPFGGISNLTSITMPGIKTLEEVCGTTYISGNNTWIELPDSLTTVIINSGEVVKTFARGCKNIRNVTIGKNVSSIGEKAFYDCTGLQNMQIECALTSLPKDMFYNCNSLKSVSLPESIETISAEDFEKCNRLKDVYYDSSRYKWRSVNTNGNTVIEKANIHYLKTEPLAYRISSVTQTGNNVIVDITKDYKCDGPLLVATYNNGALVNVILSDINMNIGENKQISVMIDDADVTDISTFVWDGFDSMIPASNNCKKN